MINAIQGKRTVRVVLSALGLAMCMAPAAWAQQKQKLVYQALAENTKYTQQHVIDVGDMPGHQVRIYEIQRKFPKDGPRFEGVQMVESWSRGYSDYIELNGPSTVYIENVMENGDRIFGRVQLISQGSPPAADGSRKSQSTIAGVITGGTGKFVGIRGTIRSSSAADIKAGVNSTQNEIEYWMVK